MSGISSTAYAAQTETLLTTITAVGSNANPATSANVSYSTEGVATLTFSGQAVAYNSSAGWGWWGYGWTATVNAAEGYTITKCIFYDDQNRTATDSEAPFVVETTEEDKTPQVNGTPILADQSKGIKKIEVYGYAASENNSSYTITIPDTLTVQNIGWNELEDGIQASGTLASGKKLVITASSNNSFNFVNSNASSEKIPYVFTSQDPGDGKTYSDVKDNGITSWTFDTLSEDAQTQSAGIVIDDYSSKPAGTYTETVTFTTKVEDNNNILVTFTVKRVAESFGDYTDGSYTVAAGTTWQQFIDSGNAPDCLSIFYGKVCHDMNNGVQDCGGTNIANTADYKHVKSDDAIIDGATYACDDYLGYKAHD